MRRKVGIRYIKTKAISSRASFLSSPRCTLVLFSVYSYSSTYQKNLQAWVEAFLYAFPNNKNDTQSKHKVGLVIKSEGPRHRHPEWEKLKKWTKKDNRIYIIEEKILHVELLDLYKGSDCFLSLPRTHGFGKSIAEILLLNLRVTATDYSRKVNLCRNN